MTLDRKVIELRDGERTLGQISVAADCDRVVCPVSRDDGFGQRLFAPSGLRTSDGFEIWMPASWTKH